MSKKIEETLSKRLASKASKDFDKDFWNKFNKENEAPKRSWFSFPVLVPMAAAIALVFVISIQSQTSSIDKTTEQIITEESEILADLDQQDWEILLGEDFDS